MNIADIDIKQLKKDLKQSQNGKRFEHTLGVAYTAIALAMKYEVPLKEAELAGLLHDCAKCMSDEERLSICREHLIDMTDVEKKNPFLLHGKVGRFLAETVYQVEEEDILNAIAYHTTGRPGMSVLEKIVFIADYIEPGRDKAKNLSKLRKSAFEDLDQTLLLILKDTLDYLHSSAYAIDSMTQKTYDFYENQISNR